VATGESALNYSSMKATHKRSKTPTRGRQGGAKHKPVGLRHIKLGTREISTEGNARLIFQDLYHYFMTVSWPHDIEPLANSKTVNPT
jgi:hypothetical protein